MNRLARRSSLALPFVLVPALALAANDAARNVAERAQDRREIRHDRAAVGNDRADRAQVETWLADFRVARKSADAKAIAALDERVEGYLASELGETTAKTASAKAEVRRDRREARTDRRELRQDRRAPAGAAVRADDRHDLRDDRRDRRDDRRDAAVQASQRDRIAALRTEWVALPDDAHDAKALARKEALLEELARIAKAEVGQDVREKAEDHRELREDRRETREDRRQG